MDSNTGYLPQKVQELYLLLSINLHWEWDGIVAVMRHPTMQS